jgi:hypothetical protein
MDRRHNIGRCHWDDRSSWAPAISFCKFRHNSNSFRLKLRWKLLAEYSQHYPWTSPLDSSMIDRFLRMIFPFDWFFSSKLSFDWQNFPLAAERSELCPWKWVRWVRMENQVHPRRLLEIFKFLINDISELTQFLNLWWNSAQLMLKFSYLLIILVLSLTKQRMTITKTSSNHSQFHCSLLNCPWMPEIFAINGKVVQIFLFLNFLMKFWLLFRFFHESVSSFNNEFEWGFCIVK